MRRHLALLFLPLVIPALPLAGQTPAERVAIESYRRSLPAGGSDTTGSRDQSFNELKDGFRLLDLAEDSSSAGNARRSADEFYEVTVRRPQWPYGWYGLGLAKLSLYRIGAREIRSPHQPAGAGWLNTAQEAFLRALREDQDFSPAAMALAEVALEDLDAPRVERAEGTLRKYVGQHPGDPLTSLALARVDIRRDSLTRARLLIERYLQAGGDSGVASWESARIAFAQDDPTRGTRLYYDAAARSAFPAVRALLRADLSLIADSTELVAFDAATPPEIASMLLEFWAGREREAGRPAGSRLPEHFRRVRYANKYFRATGEIQQSGFDQIFKGAPRGLDDRGVIQIRHGLPDERATYVGGQGVPPNESWLYFRPEGNLIYHFYKGRNTAYRLTEVLRSVDPLDPEFLYDTRANMDPIYMQLSMQWALSKARGRAGVDEPSIVSPELERRERDHNRAMIALGTTTDSDPLDLERSWTPTTQVFGTTAGLLVAIALPAPEDLHPVTLPDGGAGYTLRLRTTAANDSGQTTLDVDSIVRLRTPRPLQKGEYLNIVRAYDLPAGTQRVRVVVADSTGARGAIRVLNGVPVVSRQSDSLVLSDLIVGREGSAITWRRPDGEQVPLNPLNAWTPAQAVSLAFDLAGTTPGVSYKLRIAISDLGADSTKPPRAAVEFDKVATGTREFVSQSIALTALRPGRYLLTVTVTAGDRSVKRERRITVVR